MSEEHLNDLIQNAFENYARNTPAAGRKNSAEKGPLSKLFIIKVFDNIEVPKLSTATPKLFLGVQPHSYLNRNQRR